MAHLNSHYIQITNGMKVLLINYLKLSCESRLLIRWCIDQMDTGATEALLNLIKIGEQLGIHIKLEAVDQAANFNINDFDGYDVILYISKTKSLHRKEILSHLALNSTPLRFYRALDFSQDLFELCFRVEQEEMQALNLAVLASAKQSQEIHVTSSKGTDLLIRPDPLSGWTSSFGRFDGIYPGVFPCGEVNTFSCNVDGILVADGALSMSFPFEHDPRLAGNELIFEIVAGRAVGYRGGNAILQRMCKTLFDIDNGNRVGEIGFGTNEGIDRFVSFRSLINERVAGFHLGFGAPIQNGSYPDWSCPLHADFILAEGQIHFDGQLVFDSGQWIKSSLLGNISNVTPEHYTDAM